jgi:anti-anti-sigma factor
MAEELHVEITESPHAWSVVVRGEIDVHTAPRLQEVLEGVIEKGARLVALELEHVDFLDSSGLRVIVAVSNDLRSRDGSLMLGGASPAVLQVLEITGVIDQLRESAPE